nr:MAG TPA: ribosomal protein L7/L12 [Caudoviricetes sp.]
MDTNTNGLDLRKLETELAYYKVKLTKFEKDNERLKADLQKSHEANKSLETDLEIYETRIEELEEANKELQKVNVEYSKKLKLGKSDDERVKAAYNDGYGAAIGKMVAFVNKIKFDPASNTKQDQGTLKKALAADHGNCYFKVYKCATINNKLSIAKALKDIYDVAYGEIKSYLASLPVNGFGNVVLLDHVSETTCKKLREALRKVQIECDYFYI